MLTLHPPAFIETEGCDGPRYTRGQLSRESPGILMSDIQDKYIPEFELPYRNIDRYIHEMKNNWNRLNSEQRKAAVQSFKDMGMYGGKEMFSQEQPQEVRTCMTYLYSNPNKIGELLSGLWTPTDVGNMTQEEIKKLKEKNRDEIVMWIEKNIINGCMGWRANLLGFFLIILFIFIGVAIGSSTR
jgi:hypothetical protein